MREIKLWAGTHGDEESAMKFAESLVDDRVPGIDPDFANVNAYLAGKRFIGENLVRAFPGHEHAKTYEGRRAKEITDQSQGFFAVIDLHNIRGRGQNTGFIDTRKGVSPELLGFFKHLGITTLVNSDSGIESSVFNGCVLELTKDTLEHETDKLREALDILANDPAPQLASAKDFKWFSTWKGLRGDMLHPADVSEDTWAELHAFSGLPPQIYGALVRTLGKEALAQPGVSLFGWSSTPNENGFWGDLIIPAEVPDDRNWPPAASLHRV